MTTVRRVGIVGLGMMGGSLARALAAHDVEVVAHDRDAASLAEAIREGVVSGEMGPLTVEMLDCQVIVLATPARVACDLLATLRGSPGTALLMDLASTKRGTVAAAEAAGIGDRFVGAHPLTGSHRSGWRAGRRELFDDARVFLCPAPSTTPESLERARAFWTGLRAGTEILDAATHDEQMAWRSHLPHFVSTTLALTLRASEIQRSALGPGGRDMTRLAGGDPALWAEIGTDNAAALEAALAAMESRLRRCREAIAQGPAALERLLAEGQAWFDGAPRPPLTREASDA